MTTDDSWRELLSGMAMGTEASAVLDIRNEEFALAPSIEQMRGRVR